MMTGDEPVSPIGAYLNSSALSVSILTIFELDIPIDDTPIISGLQELFLPINPRFSSIMVRDHNGIQRWRRVETKLQDHVIIPVFPAGETNYDNHLRDYLSNIAGADFPSTRPLWDLHLIKYHTSGAAGTLMLRVHHALGDGFSLMTALFSCIRRADDPSLQFTFPIAAKRVGNEVSWWSKGMQAVSMCVNTVRDFGWGVLKSTVVEDDRSPVRSGDAGVEFKPIVISTVEFSLDDIRLVKGKLGGTVNDVITGTIFYGIHLYKLAVGGDSTKSAAVTALVLLNTRALRGYQNGREMAKPDTDSLWGNQFGFVHVPLPHCTNVEKADPLYFVLRARETIKATRSSLAVYLTGMLLETVRKIKGTEAAARYMYETLSNTSMTISNLTGPIDKVMMAGHPVRSMYFMTVRIPHSLTITVLSYNGKLRVGMGTEKGFINAELLNACIEKSFQQIFEATLGNKT